MERSFDAWEEVQRQGHDLADRLAQGFNGLIHTHITPPSIPWPSASKSSVFDLDFSSQSLGKHDFGLAIENSGINGVSAIMDIGNKLGQVGADIGGSLNGMVNQVFRRLPLPFWHEDNTVSLLRPDLSTQTNSLSTIAKESFGSRSEQLRDFGFVNDESSGDGLVDEELLGFNLKSHLGRPQGTINMTSTYDSRTGDIESSLQSRGDLWRVEASNGSSVSGNDSASLFLVQLGPVLFVRDSTLLLPLHLSKQHLLWYGYDRKSFVDMQFPNGQVTYVAGEGISTSTFLPFCGGLLQAQGKYPGDMKFSFSCKNKRGTRFTPTLQWPDKSVTMGIAQSLAWQRSGLMLKPTVQLSVSPTFGGTNPGVRAELEHTLKEHVSLICGCALAANPSVFASVSVGRSKWNGNVGNSGVVVRVETPLSNVGQPSFSVQLNSGIEF